MQHQHGDAIELKGVISDLSPRVWARGWTFGKLRVTSSRAEYKITGVLEGYVVGTRVTVRGTWKEDGKYGASVAVDSVIVDELTGDAVVVEAWFAKHLESFMPVAQIVITHIAVQDRWSVLRSAPELLELGVDVEDAAEVSAAVEAYLSHLETIRHIMLRGFTEQEAGRIAAQYRKRTEEVLDGDIYALVHDEVVPYYRVDQVATDYYGVQHDAVPRLQAAVTAALLEAARNGSTGLAAHEVREMAARYAGVYPDAFLKILEMEAAPYRFYGELLQLRRLYMDEALIARSLRTLSRRNEEE